MSFVLIINITGVEDEEDDGEYTDEEDKEEEIDGEYADEEDKEEEEIGG